MAGNYIQDGDVLEFAAPYAVAAGAGALIGTIFGVAQVTLANGERGSFQLEGVHELVKLGGEAWAEGAKVYWDNTNKRCTTTSAGNTSIGVASEAAISAATLGRVRLGIVA
jgi:predicted RecA/RadA family phage recombinase